ncbi:mobilization protein [Streptomyces sp. NPDC088197]|uniref:mobilization protein n=1 Tax=Streptomyces sp. NPDC088197 TaxID=3365840 RepID=UPI00380F2564
MVPDIQRKLGSDGRGLLGYLYGSGKHDEHLGPHLVGAWLDRGVPDPGRDQDVTLTRLADLLDVPVNRHRAEGRPRKGGHVWHCPVRTAPEDRELSDAEWGEVARRVVHATGIAPDGDEMACRWIAVRHAADHIHIMATYVREDGRAPRDHGAARRAQDECRKLERELGLRRLKSGDRTASRRPSSAEVYKAERHGWEQSSREWLREQIRTGLAHAATPEGFFDLLETGLGVNVHIRRFTESGDIAGYKVNRPGDVNKDGEPVWFAASDLAKDLSWPQARERLAANPAPEDHPTARRTRPENPLFAYADAIDTHLIPALADDAGDDGTAQAHIVAFHESLTVLTRQVPPELRQQLRHAERALARATVSQTKAEHQATREFRKTTRDLVYLATSGTTPGEDIVAVALAATIFAVQLIQQWHTRRHHQQQAEAARQTVTHLQQAVDHAAQRPLDTLAWHAPTRGTEQGFARDLAAAIPEQAARIAADPQWAALAGALAEAVQRGHDPRQLLRRTARQRELDTARSPATVLALRIQRLGHQPIPNHRAEVARMRSVGHQTAAGPGLLTSSPTAPTPQARGGPRGL